MTTAGVHTRSAGRRRRAWATGVRWLLLMVSLTPATPLTLGADPPPEKAVVTSLPMESMLPYSVSIGLPFENGRSLLLLVDTGVSASVLSRASAEAVGARVRGGSPGPYTAMTALGRELEFFVDTSATYAELKKGMEYGVLGGNFFEQFVLELDFAEERVRLLDPAHYRVPKQARGDAEAVLPIRVERRRPFAEVEVDGRALSVLLGSGAPSTLMLSNGSARKLGIKTRSLAKLAEMFSTQGPLESRLYDAESVTLAGFDLGPTPVMVVRNGYYQNSSDPALGFDALSQFSLRIDYPQQRIWLRRYRSDQRHLGFRYPEARKAGVVLMQESGEYRVYGVLPDSPAEALGLQTDDILILPLAREAQNLESILSGVAAGTPMQVRRFLNRSDARGHDVKLPNPAAYDAAMLASKQDRASAEAEAQQREREEFERKRAQRIYARTRSGWQVVDRYRIPQGPREGEERFNHEEFLELRAREASKD